MGKIKIKSNIKMLTELSNAAVAVGDHFAAIGFSTWDDIQNGVPGFTDEEIVESAKGHL